jgi:hypothetical protein
MANKVVVIPEEMWHATETRLKMEPMRKSLNEIEHAIEKLLDDENIVDSDKIKLLIQLQQRYNRIYDTRTRNLEVNIKEEQSKPSQLQTNELITTMPKLLQKKADHILNYIRDSDHLGWNQNRQLVVNGEVIPNSNIIDLVRHLIDSGGKRDHPKGWQLFKEKISELNVPTYLLAKHVLMSDITAPPHIDTKPPLTDLSPKSTRRHRKGWHEQQ